MIKIKSKTILIGGLFAIIIGSIGGYYFYMSTPTEISGLENEINISYEQWSHTTNTARTYFDIWESDSTVVILYDKDSTSSITASLVFSDIIIGRVKFRMKTLSTEYNGEMYIDFKKGNSVIFSIIRRSNGEYDFRVNNSLSSLVVII